MQAAATSKVDWGEDRKLLCMLRYVSEMTYCVSSGT